MTWDAVFRLLNIAVIDITLSGDNAIVIGMAAAPLPRKQRRWAIVMGGLCAIGLRITLTTVATILMKIPYLAAAGGVVLVWVVWKLLRADLDMEHAKHAGAEQQAANFRQAIVVIVVADFMMSLDNVLAVAGSADGSVPLLILGLLMSMPLLLTTGGLISMAIDRLRWIVWVGAAVIAFTAARMVLEDHGVEEHLKLSGLVVMLVSLVVAVVVPAACRWLLLRRSGRSALVGAGEPVGSPPEDRG